MHETHLIEGILKYLKKEEQISSKSIKKIYIKISQFGSIKKEHFIEHYKKAILGTKWQSMEIDIKEVPAGSELEIVKIDFFKD